jgi:polyphosphate kinase
LTEIARSTPTPEPSTPEKATPELLLNPELSRLAFDERIIAFAEDASVPLLERVRFLGMAGDRLDDFFMSRVAHFKRVLADGGDERTIDGLTASEQLAAINSRVRRMVNRAIALLDTLRREVEAQGIEVIRWADLDAADRERVRAEYGERIASLVRPMLADKLVPHIRNLRPVLAVRGRETATGAERLLMIQLPSDLPRFLPLQSQGNRTRFVPIGDVITAALPELYPGLEHGKAYLFRVTRSAAMELDDEPADMLRAIEISVKLRPFQEVVRLEVAHDMPDDLRKRLLWDFRTGWEGQGGLTEDDMYDAGPLLDLASLSELADIDRPELKFKPIERRPRVRLEHAILEHARRRDLLLQFPYDDFEKSVERFLLEAAEDPQVERVWITVYRTSKDSAIMDALRKARGNGKQVTAVIELKASFDEEANVEWARELEADGIDVILSPVGIKVHAKIGLIERREGSELKRVAYIGTGNMNASTARSYVDFGLLTADPELTSEVASVFDMVAGRVEKPDFRRLIVSPIKMRRRFKELIDREIAHMRAGRPAGIRVHINGLGDRQIIGLLYEASQAGVKIEMMVRDLCALRPGLPGVSDNISVVSVVGRLLHHARIFHFRNGGDDEYFIGSADWRPRNFNERVEVVAQIRQEDHQKELDKFLTDTLNAQRAWRLRADGSYVRGTAVIPSEARNLHG